jgi:hypothetical protein
MGLFLFIYNHWMNKKRPYQRFWMNKKRPIPVVVDE